ncbi:venom serine protease 34-like [Penaeus chinensis]|uniref:venom serine protease 34-like n=1 Tax=Penaeus chinensis TaxID=139456 RepID=UPI001FB6C3FB|nr:venom serine protease 34-like [Penaeus chinensis]
MAVMTRPVAMMRVGAGEKLLSSLSKIDPLKRLKNFRKCFAQLLCSFRWKELETFGEKKFGSLIVENLDASKVIGHHCVKFLLASDCQYFAKLILNITYSPLKRIMSGRVRVVGGLREKALGSGAGKHVEMLESVAGFPTKARANATETMADRVRPLLLTLTFQVSAAILWNSNYYSTSNQQPGYNRFTVFLAPPSYPNPYEAFTFCSWMIYSTTGNSLTLTCQVFDLQPSGQCGTGAYFSVDDGLQNTRSMLTSAYHSQLNQLRGATGSSAEVTLPLNRLPRRVPSSACYSGAARAGAGTYTGFYCTVSLLSSISPTLPPGVITTPSTTTCRCGRRGSGARVVGGENASLHEFPWQALVILPNDNSFCGGALINERFVLTVAHCLLPPELPTGSLPEVVLGEHDRSTTSETSITRRVKVKRLWPHENYDEGTSRDNDIGLIELEEDVVFDRVEIAPACPPEASNSYENVDAVITGWGLDDSGQLPNILQKAEIRAIPLATCRAQYSSSAISNNMICAGAAGRDSCLSDSGGPLITFNGASWTLIGLASFGPVPCGDPDRFGVYTRVGNYIPWIINKIGNARTCLP